jgi:hypothetical protein
METDGAMVRGMILVEEIYADEIVVAMESPAKLY